MGKKIMYKDEWITVEHETTKVRGKEVLVKRYMQPDVVVVVPVLEDGKLLMEKQYRYAHKKYLYEFPAGGVENGETAAQAAERELREETGYAAKRMAFLFKVYMSTHNLRQIHFFCAKGLRKQRQQQLEAEEVIELMKLKPREVESMIKQDKIEDGKTITGFLYCKQYNQLD